MARFCRCGTVLERLNPSPRCSICQRLKADADFGDLRAKQVLLAREVAFVLAHPEEFDSAHQFLGELSERLDAMCAGLNLRGFVFDTEKVDWAHDTGVTLWIDGAGDTRWAAASREASSQAETYRVSGSEGSGVDAREATSGA